MNETKIPLFVIPPNIFTDKFYQKQKKSFLNVLFIKKKHKNAERKKNLNTFVGFYSFDFSHCFIAIYSL